MEDLGFKCVKSKKSHVTAVHEREDVVKDREIYLKRFATTELQESCWIQLSKKDLNNVLNSHGIDETKKMH